MKEFIKKLELRWSDLFLLIGFLGFAIFLVFGQEFMQQQDPSVVALPLWLGIICFILMIGSWGAYLYLELYKRKVEFNKYIAFAFIGLVLFNVVAILVQPSASTENVIIRLNEVESLIGTSEPASLVVTGVHKFIFIAEYIGTGMFLYIALFLFSKRITNIKFIEYLGYALFALIFVMIIYSYIAEAYKYAGFIKYVLGIDRNHDLANEFSVISFVIHKNAFGMICMLGILFCLINQSIKPRWFYYPLIAYFFISMIFSMCKTGMLLSVAIIFIYFIYRLIVTYKEHPKRNKITFIVLGGVIFLGLIFVGVPYLTKGKIFGKIYEIIASLTKDGVSMRNRECIWDNAFQLLGHGWWLIGRGFGTVNLQLWPMNVISHGENVFPTHSSFLNMLAQGGIITFLAYLALLTYFGYVIFKSYKKSPEFVFSVSLGALCFFLYSFIETIHYLMYIYMFLIFVIYNQKEKETQA